MELSNREVKRSWFTTKWPKVSIYSSDSSSPVSGKVEGVTSGGENTLTKRFINKITID